MPEATSDKAPQPEGIPFHWFCVAVCTHNVSWRFRDKEAPHSREHTVSCHLVFAPSAEAAEAYVLESCREEYVSRGFLELEDFAFAHFCAIPVPFALMSRVLESIDAGKALPMSREFSVIAEYANTTPETYPDINLDKENHYA